MDFGDARRNRYFSPYEEQIETYVRQTLAAGKVIPGYGHAVLRVPDPRFTAQQKFAEMYFPDDELVNVVWDIFDVVPKVLSEKPKIKSPWPNVDAHSGATLMHYGLKGIPLLYGFVWCLESIGCIGIFVLE